VNDPGAGVLTFSEHAGIAQELLGIARTLADARETTLVAAIVGRNAQERGRDAIARGADHAVLLPLPDGSAPSGDAYLEAMHATVRAHLPALVLLGATRAGLEVAARLAQRLHVGCVSDALSLEIDRSGRFLATRRVYGGRFLARVALGATPAIVTIPPGRLEAPPPDAGRRGSISELSFQLPAPRLRTVAVHERPHSATDIRKAPTVVAVGRGLKRPEDLDLVHALCEALGAALGASRPVTDDLRWLPHDRKIGLSGQTVQPSLYVACGISGQVEHIVGMRGARTVVAINSDPDAPIHAQADYSLVGDLYAIVPALTQALREAKERHAGGIVDSLR